MSNEQVGGILGPVKRGSAFVVSGPAGTGKTTLVAMLMREFPNVKESISCTTRPARPGEVSGEHYEFLDAQEFAEKVEAGEFLEHVDLFQHSYGTLGSHIEEQRSKGNHVILVIDTQGALKVKESSDFPLIFISPPSVEELRERLMSRKTESPEALENRLKRASEELALIPQYAYHIVNHDLSTAYQVLRSIIISEIHRTSKS